MICNDRSRLEIPNLIQYNKQWHDQNMIKCTGHLWMFAVTSKRIGRLFSKLLGKYTYKTIFLISQSQQDKVSKTQSIVQMVRSAASTPAHLASTRLRVRWRLLWIVWRKSRVNPVQITSIQIFAHLLEWIGIYWINAWHCLSYRCLTPGERILYGLNPSWVWFTFANLEEPIEVVDPSMPKQVEHAQVGL